ncbi:hypothetical protein ACS0TY_002808 [Phlomoides rotata]
MFGWKEEEAVLWRRGAGTGSSRSATDRGRRVVARGEGWWLPMVGERRESGATMVAWVIEGGVKDVLGAAGEDGGATVEAR